MDVQKTALLALVLSAILLPAVADTAEATATVAFHYDTGILYKETVEGNTVNTNGIEGTIALGTWYYTDGAVWTPEDIITGDTDLYLGAPPAPAPAPAPDDDPVPDDHTPRGAGHTGLMLLLGIVVASGIAVVAYFAVVRRP